MTTYSIQAVKFCEQLCPGPEMYHLAAWGEWINVYFYFWILRGGGKTILVDTGLRDMDSVNPAIIATFGEKGKFRMDMDRENIPRLLRENNVRPEDVDYVFITHLHLDHAGNIPLFPNATFVISRRGWIETLAPRYPSLVPAGFFPRDVLAYLVGEAYDRLYLAEDDEEDIVPGIGVFWTGGHTMCSQAIKVQTEKGIAVLTGDVAFLYDNIEKNHPVGLSYSIPECLDAMERIRREADIIIPAHDPLVMDRYPGGRIA